MHQVMHHQLPRLVQHIMLPSIAAHALNQLRQQIQDQISEVQIEGSSRRPELKKLKSCNFSYKRQCGLLGLLDE